MVFAVSRSSCQDQAMGEMGEEQGGGGELDELEKRAK